MIAPFPLLTSSGALGYVIGIGPVTNEVSMKYLCQIYNEAYGYWDSDKEFATAREAMAYQQEWVSFGWKTRCRRIA